MGSLSIKNGTLSLLYSNNGEQREAREGVIREREKEIKKREK